MIYKPEKVIINNPDRLELCRFHLDLIIDEAINVKDNSLTDHETFITDNVEIIDADNTKVYYNYKGSEVEIHTSIKADTMEINFNQPKQQGE